MTAPAPLGLDRDAGAKKDDDVHAAPPMPVCAPQPAVASQDRIDISDESLAASLSGDSATWFTGAILEHLEIWGGLRGFECSHPLSYPPLRKTIVATTGSASLDWAYAHDDELLRLVRNSVTLQRHARELAGQYQAGSAGATKAYELADQHELNYALALSAFQQDGETVLPTWLALLDKVDPETLHVDEAAHASQQAADDAADEAASWKAIGETVLDRQIAVKEVPFWWDDDVTLDALSMPEDGIADFDRAIAWARLAHHAAAVVQVQGRYFVYTLNHDYEYDDLWETESFEEHRTALVPDGSLEARAIITSDSYVVTPRDGERFFGGYQSRTASQDLIADLAVAEDRGADVDAPALVQQIAFDMLMLQLSDAEQRLHTARAALEPDGYFDPAGGELLQTDTADLKFHVVRAAQLSWEASDPPTDDQRAAMEDELQEIGRISSLDPMAASMLVNKRDADDKSRPDESQYEDRVAGKKSGDALQLALDEIEEKLGNIDKVRKHFYAHPAEVWGMDDLIAAARQQLPDSQQFSISYDIFTRTVAEIGSFMRNVLKEAGLLALGFMTGESWFGLAVWGYQSLRGAAAVQEGFAGANLLDAMANLDLAGGMQLATPEQADTARKWAWIGLGLAVLDGCMFVRSATHMFRLSAVMSDPELAQVIKYTGRPIGDLAKDLGMSERKLVAELAAARGSAREGLLGKIRALQPIAETASAADRAIANAATARARATVSDARVGAAWDELKLALRSAAGRANMFIGTDLEVLRALVKLAYRYIEKGFGRFADFLAELRLQQEVPPDELAELQRSGALQQAYDQAAEVFQRAARRTNIAKTIEDLDEVARDRILSRVVRGDAKGRAFGTPRNGRMPTIEEFNPRLVDIQAGDIESAVADTKHGLFPDQAGSVRSLSNEDLMALFQV